MQSLHNPVQQVYVQYTSDIVTNGHVWSSTSLEMPTQAECNQRMGPHINVPPLQGWRLSSSAAPHLAHEASISLNRYTQISILSWFQNTAGHQLVEGAAVIIHPGLARGHPYSINLLTKKPKIGPNFRDFSGY